MKILLLGIVFITIFLPFNFLLKKLGFNLAEEKIDRSFLPYFFLIGTAIFSAFFFA